MLLLISLSLFGQGFVVVKWLFNGKFCLEIFKIFVVIIGGKFRDEVIKLLVVLKIFNMIIFCVGVGQNIDRIEFEIVVFILVSDYVIMVVILYCEIVGENFVFRIKKGDV